MALFDAHLDSQLPALARGTVAPRRFRRMLAHAKTCHRCAALYQRAIHTLRQLEHGSPFEPAAVEQQAIGALTEKAVLRKGRSPAERFALWLVPMAAVAAAAAVVLAPLWRVADGELSPRGGGEGTVSLRVFCGGGGQPMKELREAEGCVSGRSLAFAAGAAAAGQSVAVVVSGSAASWSEALESVAGTVGAEAPVALTVELARRGEVTVVAAFSAEAEAARAAARGGTPASGVVVVRRVVRVEW